MSNSISAANIRKLYGSEFQMTNRDGAKVTVSIPVQEQGWPRLGSEAYGVKANINVKRMKGSEKFPSFLKLFINDVAARAERTQFLVNSGLSKQNQLYHGIPFGWLGRLPSHVITPSAHFTRMISGPFNGEPLDFGRIRDRGLWKKYDIAARRRFAAELCVAVAGLENASIVHGDISPGNIIIGSSSNLEDTCILCDYDGFFHRSVPRLPRSAPRPLGTSGFIYPCLVTEIEKDRSNDADIFVETDRYALGALICELIVWDDKISNLVNTPGRSTGLIDDKIVETRDMSLLPREVYDLFPGGFELMSRALGADTIGQMPSPIDWLQMLGFSDKPIIFDGKAIMTLYQRHGDSQNLLARYRLNSKSGVFSDAELKKKGILDLINKFSINWSYENHTLSFSIITDSPIRRRRNRKIFDISKQFGPLFVADNDVIHIGNLDIEISSAPDINSRP